MATANADFFAVLDALAVAGGAWGNVGPDNPAFPLIVYSRSPSPVNNSFAGASLLNNSRFQVDCYDKTYLGAFTVAQSVIDAMKTAGFTNVLENEFDSFDSDTKLHRVTLEFSVWHT